MKILHVSDFHFNKRWFGWLAEHAGKFDACCLTGDLLDLFGSARSPAASMHAQAQWVHDWLKAFAGPRLYVCSGNNDLFSPPKDGSDPLANYGFLHQAARANSKVKVDGTDEIFGGVRFVCSPWGAPPALLSGTEPVVLLAHAPPEGTELAGSGAGGGTDEMNTSIAAAQLPDGSIVLSGHNHEPTSWHARVEGATCFNPGCDGKAAIPNRIIINTERRSAFFEGRGGVLGPIRL